jgi:hypothetical protein
LTTLNVIAAIVFLLYCFMEEWNCGGKHTPTIVRILCRLVARHVKLAWKLLVGLIYFFGVISISLQMMPNPYEKNAPQGQLANFVDRATTPVQIAVDAALGFLGLVGMGALLGSLAVVKNILLHPMAYGMAAAVLYLLWLGVTICDLVEDEVVFSWTITPNAETGGNTATGVLTKQDYIAWSAATFVIWITILLTTGAWVCSRIPTLT